MGLDVMHLKQREANAFVAKHHRHHRPPQGDLFRIGAVNDAGELVGVVIVGRPVSRHIQRSEPHTAEITRLCSDGTKNACSFLYGAAWKAARALGWRKLITYTLPEEGGASLRGAGYRCVGVRGGGTWDRPNRARTDKHPTQQKLLWAREQRSLDPQGEAC